jgi:hypothetical protein
VGAATGVMGVAPEKNISRPFFGPADQEKVAEIEATFLKVTPMVRLVATTFISSGLRGLSAPVPCSEAVNVEAPPSPTPTTICVSSERK